MNKKATAKKKNRTTWILLTALAVIIVAGIVLSRKRSGNSLIPSQTTEMLNIPFNKQGELVFIGKENGDTLSVIDIEVADNDQKRARGLMYRASIPENGGMLFIHDVEDIQSFWMKNTYISLDMLFVNTAKEIVTIHAGTQTLKEWNYTSTAPALYVVEVNAGYSAKNNIKVGDKIDYQITP